jgi:hypothetical protein
MKIIKCSYVKILICSLLSITILLNSFVKSNSMEAEKTLGGEEKYLKQNGKKKTN